MNTAVDLFENSLDWLRANYSNFRFSVERDVVWTLQTHLQQEIDRLNLPYRVFNDYPILPGSHRGLSADLVILAEDNRIDLAVEFKYEPSRNRKDVQQQKLPVVSWGIEGIAKDILRIHEFVERGKTPAAYFIFIDEGGRFHNRIPHPQSAWIEWDGGVWALRSQVHA